jgi:hypothetical protein
VKGCLSALIAVIVMGTAAYGYPPYHDISDHAQAEAEAQERKLPLAWLGGFPELFNQASPDPGSQADLQQMALATLQGSAVVVFFDGKNMAPVPEIVHAQFHLQDDGILANGAAWVVPKVVFTDPGVTKILGRVSQTQMQAGREAVIYPVLQSIRNDPSALQPAPVIKSAAQPDAGAGPNSDNGYEADTWFGKISITAGQARFLDENRDTIVKMVFCVTFLLIVIAWWRSRS